MSYYIAKVVVTTLLVILIAELSKRSTLAGAVLASIPLVSVMAICWLYLDTKDLHKVINLSSSVFWLVLPSLVLFVVLPVLLKLGFGFLPSLTISIISTAICYLLMMWVLGYFGIKL